MVDKYQEEIDIILKARGVQETKDEAQTFKDVWKESLKTVQNYIKDLQGMKFADAFNIRNQINEHMRNIQPISLDSFLKQGPLKINFDLVIPEFESGGLEKMIEGSSTKSILKAFQDISVAIDSIRGDAVIFPEVQEATLNNLQRYKELLSQTDVIQRQTAGEGGTKVTQFLDRYKYSLLLVGGALGSIVGMMRYSTTFGTALDVIGSALGYLADVILYPLLPYVMVLAEWIMGLAGWFNDLPDPIKLVTTAILGLGASFLLLRALGVTGILSGIGKGLLELGPAGWLGLAILTTAIAAYLTNFGNFRDNFNKLISDILGGWDRLIHGDLTGVVKFGIEIGFDLIKIGEDLSDSVNGVISWVSQKSGETFSKLFLDAAKAGFKSNISSMLNFGKIIEEYISGLTLAQTILLIRE